MAAVSVCSYLVILSYFVYFGRIIGIKIYKIIKIGIEIDFDKWVCTSAMLRNAATF